MTFKITVTNNSNHDTDIARILAEGRSAVRLYPGEDMILHHGFSLSQVAEVDTTQLNLTLNRLEALEMPDDLRAEVRALFPVGQYIGENAGRGHNNTPGGPGSTPDVINVIHNAST